MSGALTFGAANFSVRRAVIAGWTGRNAAAVEHHIEELARIGVKRPSRVPLYYRVSADLVTQSPTIQTLGDASSGEAEPVLVSSQSALLLTLGSDQTDRVLEARSVALSKQACPKPVASEAWEIARADLDTLDDCALRSFTSSDGKSWAPYQDGHLASIRPLAELLAGAEAEHGFGQGLNEGECDVLFCGTIVTLDGEMRPAPWFKAQLDGPQGTIELVYRTEPLPEVE